VKQRYPLHTPMWRLHEGSLAWVTLLCSRDDVVGCAEFDVEDCFLNTPRQLVLQALDYWLNFCSSRTRQQPWFAISKDGKHADHRGRPCSLHYWELSVTQLRALVVWEMDNNASFKVAAEDGRVQALEQHRGLPIGGHFSAALVELVALWREYTVGRPPSLADLPTSRYRDNYFVALTAGAAALNYQSVAAELTNLLAMPVKFEQAGTEVRCLELRLRFQPGRAVHVTVAFRTDPDRQGEAGNVTSWPGRFDPRTPRVLPGLLAGLAAKLRHYRAPGAGGFTADIRRAVQFIKAKGYPSRWWVRRFGLALLRQGVPHACLPHLLRGATRTQNGGRSGGRGDSARTEHESSGRPESGPPLP
jgi:hypothetical protein